jgi:hypothetical protein
VSGTGRGFGSALLQKHKRWQTFGEIKISPTNESFAMTFRKKIQVIEKVQVLGKSSERLHFGLTGTGALRKFSFKKLKNK